MKKRNIKYIALFFTAFTVLSACKKDFLEVELIGDTSLESNYYKTPAEAFAGLVSVYDPLGTEAGGIDNTYANRLGPLNAASDDCYAGGGGPTDMDTWQAWNKYTLDAAKGPQGPFWSRNYTGVYRANLLLTKLNDVPGLAETVKARYIAETKWLRAYYYFNLVRLFKNIPLFTAPIPTADIFNLTQAKPEEVYAQIEKDLNEAIPALPTTVPKATEGGRITMGAAKALLGKALLYQNDNSKML